MKKAIDNLSTSVNSPIILSMVVPENYQGGWAAITIAPGKKTQGRSILWHRDLNTDLDRLKMLHTSTLVTLLPNYEIEKLKITNIFTRAIARGIDVIQYPIVNEGCPEERIKFMDLIHQLCLKVNRGERVVAHCNGGLGRAGILAACLRLALGMDESAEIAIEAVRNLRSQHAIENKKQEQFISDFHAYWNKRYTVEEASTMDKQCKTCVFWQNYEQRVYARIAKARGDIARGLMELRLCTWQAHPSVDIIKHDVYTDKEFHCNSYQAKPALNLDEERQRRDEERMRVAENVSNS